MRRAIDLAISLLLASSLAHAMPPAPFTEEAVSRGINYSMPFTPAWGFGIALVDLDEDGDPDAVMVGRSDGRVGLYENDGTGNFTDRSLTSGIPLIADASGLCAGDYDADGDLDLYFSNFIAANLLMRNDGAFGFTDVTAAAGVGDIGAGEACTWGDYDLDGRIDLYLANRTGSNDGAYIAGEPNRLYRNLGDGSFLDVLSAVGMVADRLTFQGVLFDFDRDGDADIYVSNDKCGGVETNRLWENDNGTFTDITTASQTGVCLDSMGVAVGDFDGNLLQDLYPTNTPEGNPLLLNQGSGLFTDTAATAAVASYATGWAAMFLDYDNDTHQELYVCNFDTGNRLYDHDGSWPSVDVAPSVACDDGGFSYGGAHGDVDGDGDLDIAVSNSQGDVHLYINHEGEMHNWIRFDVRGQGENLDGIGALVDLRLGTTWQLREVLAGSNSYKSQNEMKLHFGMYTATAADEVVVTWPGATTSRTIAGLAANNSWTLYPPEFLGDADLDGDNDVDDFYSFDACYPSALVPGCETMDLDGDADVDDDDFNEFLLRYDGIVEDCNTNSVTDLRDILDDTSSDLDQDGRPDECPAAAPAGAIPTSGSGGGLTLQRVGADVVLNWTASCESGDTDYGIYGGVVGDYGDPDPLTCSTVGAMTWSLTPLGGDRYYLVVPRNSQREGAYGQATSGARSASATACVPQDVAACP